MVSTVGAPLSKTTLEDRVESLLSIRGLNKTYPDGTKALVDLDLEIPEGQLVAIIGLSGAGKSTLMRCINRLVEPTSGQIFFKGSDITAAKQRELRLRRREIGMIFQQFNLVQRLPAITNVLHGRLGYTGAVKGSLGLFPEEDVERALEVLAKVGLEGQAFKRCSELSGGQMQRVGIARAMMQNASLILADEPIASLDVSSSKTVMRILKEVAVSDGITTVVNLHQVDFAKEFADRIVGLREGRLRCDELKEQLTDEMIDEVYYGPAAHEEDEG